MITILLELLEGAIRSLLAPKPDLEAFKQTLMNAERRVSDELAKKELP